MATLYITRGLPGSGKTTKAKTWVAKDPENRVRVNRDDLRGMIHDGYYEKGVTEQVIIAARDNLVMALLRKGKDVVVDDTNLPSRVVKDLMKLAARTGAGFEVWDLTNVLVGECVERDLEREKTVGEEVIWDMYRKYVKNKPFPLPLPEISAAGTPIEPYEAKPGTPPTVLVDIDGTVAKMNGRQPYDYSRVGEDLPNEPVISLVRSLLDSNYQIVFLSGRPDSCVDDTIDWLRTHVTHDFKDIFMRKAGDFRKDAIVKRELFDQYVRDHYDVRLVLDDRNQVVEMWRSLGLTCLQVAEGDF